MTPQAQQRAIAIACGKTPSCAPDEWNDTPEHHDWREWRTQDNPRQFRFRICNKCQALHIEGERWVSFDDDHKAPDYLHDLNAIREAVKTLNPDQKHEMNRWLLATRPGNLTRYKWEAEADELSEAFLRALGLWVEEPESQLA